MAHYNLADVLTEMGQLDDAAAHWRAFLRVDSIGERAAYAQQQLA